MTKGQWIKYQGWKIWVEDHWLDRRTPTHLSVAREIHQSGWLKEWKS